MKAYLVFRSLVAVACCAAAPGSVLAQHSDVEFHYDGGRIVVEFGLEGPVFEGELALDGIDRQFTSEPGFASELDEGLGINPGDQVVYNVLDDLIYWDGTAFEPPAPGTQIRIFNRPPSVPDTIVSAGSGIQPGSFLPALNRIGAADGSGDFHSDLDWALEPNLDPAPAPPPAIGAYGVKLSLSTDADGIGDSDPFFLVFNFGLEEEDFEVAVAAFAGLIVPEPGSAVLLAVGALILVAGSGWCSTE